MDINEYARSVAPVATYPEGIKYAALGLAGEAGEVANIVKKIFRDDDGVITQERREMILDEIGDVYWYLAAMCDEIGVKPSQALEHNIAKLSERYGVVLG